MDDAREVWSVWQSLLTEFRPSLPWAVGCVFAAMGDGLVLCAEEHTITQILTALGSRIVGASWSALLEYGAWDREALNERDASGRRSNSGLGKIPRVAIDDTKEHRTSRTCGARAPFTSRRLDVPTEPTPSAPTTGWCWGN